MNSDALTSDQDKDVEKFVRARLVGADALKSFVLEVEKLVRAGLETPRQNLDPGLVVLTKSCRGPLDAAADDAGNFTIIKLGDFLDDMDKRQKLRRAGASFCGTGKFPVAVVLFAETWKTGGKTGQRPSPCADREECVSVVGVAQGLCEQGPCLSHSYLGIMKISRDQAGRIVPGEFDIDEGGDYLLSEFFDGYADAMRRWFLSTREGGPE